MRRVVEKSAGETMRRRHIYWPFMVLLAVGAVLCLWAVLAHAYGPTVVPLSSALQTARPEPVAVDRYLVECREVGQVPTIPTVDATGIREKAAMNRGNMRRLDYEMAGRRVHGVTHRLGSQRSGWSWYAVRGPVPLRAELALAGCRVVPYTTAKSEPPPVNAWLEAAGMTCCGAATWRGRAFTSWPCSWTTEREGQGTVTRLDGYGPGVVGGRSACADYAAETP
jgi:hypothetical protein